MRTSNRSAVRRIAAARLISLSGSEAAFTALLFVLYRRTGSATWVSAALLCTFGTMGALTPIGGWLGDHLDRRRVLIGSDLLGAVFFASLALVHAPVALLLLAFLAAACEAVFSPTSTGAIPSLAGQESLAWANGTVATGANIGFLIGPALGGALVAVFGSSTVFALNALSFVLSAAIVASVRAPFAAHSPREGHRGLRAGFVFILHDPVLRTMAMAFVVFAVTIGSVLVAELPLATSFHTGSVGYGLIATCFGLGALLGSLAGRGLRPSAEHRTLVLASAVTAVGIGSVAFAPAFVLVLVGMLVSGTSDGLVDVAVLVISQRRAPDEVRSRVAGAMETVFLLGIAISFLFAGSLVNAIGPKAAYLIAGAGCGIAALLLVPLLRIPSSAAPTSGRSEPVLERPVPVDPRRTGPTSAE